MGARRIGERRPAGDAVRLRLRVEGPWTDRRETGDRGDL
jgi:hypothetical protein